MAASVVFLSGLLTNHPSGAVTKTGRYAQLERGLKRIVRDRRGARQIGDLYLAAHPEERDLERLAGELMVGIGELDSGFLPGKIMDLRLRDFANEETVIIGGWVLARVEARVCALIRLL